MGEKKLNNLGLEFQEEEVCSEETAIDAVLGWEWLAAHQLILTQRTDETNSKKIASHFFSPLSSQKRTKINGQNCFLKKRGKGVNFNYGV